MKAHALITALSVVVLGTAHISTPVQAQEPALCQFQRAPEQGLGGTGINSTDVLSRLTSIIPVEQGIGGSGYSDDLERGLGGTGMVASNERGLGGTGIIGVVTGFASICVNGYEVHVDNQTTISVEGFAAVDGDLQLGQLVAVEAYTVAGALVASSVEVQIAVAGPIEYIAADASSLTVAGQTVLVSGFGGSVDMANVVPGDWVVASGLRRADDAIAASSIISLDGAGQVVVVSGPVRTRDASTARIGGLAVATDRIPDGQVVVVRGAIENGQLTPDVVSVRPALPFTAGVQTLSVQGFALTGANGTPQIGGVPLSGNQPPTPSGQQPLQVEGTITPDGQLIPSTTFAPPPPTNGALPKPPPTPPPPAPKNSGSGQGNGGQGNGSQGNEGQQSNPPPSQPLPQEGQGASQGGGQGSGQGGSEQGGQNQTGGNATSGNGPAPASNTQVPQTGSAAAQSSSPPAERPTQVSPEPRPVQSDRPSQVDRPARPEQPARPERPTRPERVERPDRPDRPDRPERPERPN